MAEISYSSKCQVNICVDINSGKIVHDIKLAQSDSPDPINPMNSYASPTPAIVGGKVICHFGNYGTWCIDEKSGEIYFLVVHPDYQNRGVGSQLIQFALNHIEAAGMAMATVSTGGDPSHAPARNAYEKAGFVGIPSVWYAKKFDS